MTLRPRLAISHFFDGIFFVTDTRVANNRLLSCSVNVLEGFTLQPLAEYLSRPQGARPTTLLRNKSRSQANDDCARHETFACGEHELILRLQRFGIRTYIKLVMFLA